MIGSNLTSNSGCGSLVGNSQPTNHPRIYSFYTPVFAGRVLAENLAPVRRGCGWLKRKWLRVWSLDVARTNTTAQSERVV